MFSVSKGYGYKFQNNIMTDFVFEALGKNFVEEEERS